MYVQLIQQQYNTNLYSLITYEDITMYMKTNLEALDSASLRLGRDSRRLAIISARKPESN